MDGYSKPKEDYISFEDALKDYDAGCNVDTATLSRLASQEQGSYQCEFSFGDEGDLQKMYATCRKAPGHKNFTLLENLTLDSLPAKCRHQTILDTVKLQGALTVKIISRYVSKNRPDLHPRSGTTYLYSNLKGSHKCRRSGTGIVVRVDVERANGQTCGCGECKVDGGDAKTWYRVVIATCLHVVYDQSEADQTEVEFSLETEDGVNVFETLKGGWNHEQINQDVATLSVFTHKEGLCSNLVRVNEHFRKQRHEASLWLNTDDQCSFSSIVSHPHGQAKHVSFGNFLSEVPLGRMLFPEAKSTPMSPLSASLSKLLRFYFGNTTTIYNTPTCPGSSGSFIFRYRYDHISIHEGFEPTEGFNVAGDDSDLNVLCPPFNSKKDVSVEIPITREWLHGSHLDGFMDRLLEVRAKYAELITRIENFTKSEVDEIITNLATIVKKFDDVGLQESSGQEGASKAGTASPKETIITELVKFVKNYNGEDLLARKVSDTPMKYPTASGINKIIRDLYEIIKKFDDLRLGDTSSRSMATDHLSNEDIQEEWMDVGGTDSFITFSKETILNGLVEFVKNFDDDALDMELRDKSFQQMIIKNSKTSGIKKLLRDSAQITRRFEAIKVFLGRLGIQLEAHIADAALLSDGLQLLTKILSRIDRRRDLLCRLVEEIHQ